MGTGKSYPLSPELGLQVKKSLDYLIKELSNLIDDQAIFECLFGPPTGIVSPSKGMVMFY